MIAVARLATAIGLAGLIPFILGALSVLLFPEAEALCIELFYTYSAGVLAFMAGVYWPIALQLEDRCFPLSPVVTLIISQLFFVTAGLSLLLPLAGQMVVYPLAYIALYIVDARWMRIYWPDWYRKLRLVLTVVACVCLVTVAIALGLR
ncbi:MAG: aspartate kinase [Alteromonadaceae bacterium]|uniref:DUF3429 domain-containing protein n=1 Tax=unclassified Marinobacter TaxID=83889 RepID=UPI000C4DD929|nr:DUF3429 domain-containing protein [Marinobacter sp. BGYM27]MAA65413.1 aspartate kinase [Alteromonadaceae bacterium]MBH85079.1 aspartate kinase [Alteromonadaceae bacterium]MDG5500128.1 DUF3429 domain-containing protein [Marinobacter sp. BGYM27]|tara:strand:- start:164 stop:610 length:447 start_codon:yes stop_codon:yes gene_type:complete